MTEQILVHTSDDQVFVLDDYGMVHVYEVQSDGSLTKIEVDR